PVHRTTLFPYTTLFRSKEKIRYVEEFAEIGDYFDQPLSTYSSGMQARVAFGTSMAFDFDYYLIDEVMAVGDATFKRKSRKVFKRSEEHTSELQSRENLV